MAFNRYAAYYDFIYKNKEYKRECDFLESLFEKYLPGKPKTILDFGCGTGNHMYPLLMRGYQVTGVDRSAKMLALAKKKISQFSYSSSLHLGDLQSIRLNKKFDCVICMFSVIDYLLKNQELLNALRNVKRHMLDSSVFIFDFWQDSAVENYYTPQKKRSFSLQDKTLIRSSVTKLLPARKICEVNYSCLLRDSKHVLASFKEKHTMRYFSVQEMENFLNKAGLQLIGKYPFLNIGGQIRKNTWDVTFVAQKA